MTCNTKATQTAYKAWFRCQTADSFLYDKPCTKLSQQQLILMHVT